MEFGIIESITIGRNLDSGENVRIAKVKIIGEDIVTVELPFPEGDEFCPAIGDTVYYEEVDSGFLVARCIQSNVAVDSSLNEGERELFSRSGSSRSARLRLKSNGEVVLNAGDDYAIRFAKLESALNSALTTLNSTIDAIISHTHPAPGGATQAPANAPAMQKPSLDISDAKVEKVRL